MALVKCRPMQNETELLVQRSQMDLMLGVPSPNDSSVRNVGR